QALPIYHPDLARNHFTEVSVASIGGMIHDGVGGAIVIVDFIEYKPPKPKPVVKAAAKPGASSAAPIGPPKPDPNAAAKAELAALLEEARRPGVSPHSTGTPSRVASCRSPRGVRGGRISISPRTPSLRARSRSRSAVLRCEARS